MVLCSACQKISLSALISKLQNVPDWWKTIGSQSNPRGMVHHEDARQLPLSAARGCALCSMMIDAVLQYNGNHTPKTTHTSDQPIWNIAHFQEHLSSSPIYIRPKHDPVKGSFPDDDVAGALHFRGFMIYVPVDHGILTGQIRLWAPQDSPAAVSCDVIGRGALPSSDSPDAYNLIHRWMSTCLSKHKACRETFSGMVLDESHPPVLPTRIIDVGSTDGDICPRLIETNGKAGHYVSLSHCWGPPSERPLMTTQATLQTHLARISWDTIPRVYQDAIKATRRIGLQYIWIDSLCIIQDSHSDWLTESKRMGTVYENARLTLAASHASDSSQGCFFTRSQPANSVKLPYVSQTGEVRGSMHATSMPRDYGPITPELGPLAQRAWATQEWLLSRRMIFYTTNCLVWSCKIITQHETGGSFHSTARNPRWKIIVERYSARLLTKATDRLIALEGLRTEMGKKRPTDVYCLGLWKNSMPDQLLWFCKEPAEREKNPLDLPTWTWASTMHGVRFLEIQKAKNVCDKFQFDGANTLTIRTCIRKAPRIMTPLPTQLERKGTSHAHSALMEGLHILPMGTVCGFCGDDGVIFGWAGLDEPDLSLDADLYCLQLMSRNVVVMEHPGKKLRFQEEWVLLLRKSSKDQETYERIGAGKLLSSNRYFKDLGLVQVCLV